MPMLYILCLKTERPVATGVKVTAEEKRCMSKDARSTICPYCCQPHTWFPDETAFEFQLGDLLDRLKPGNA